MGGGMALLFAEHGLTVSLSDPQESAMDGLIKEAKEKGFGDRLKKFTGMLKDSEYRVPWFDTF